MRNKKYIGCVLAMALVFAAAGCGNKKVDKPGDSSVETNEDEAAEEIEQEEEYELDEEGTDLDAEEEALPTESSLKGTGPATIEDSASSTDASESGGIKDGDVLVDINFDDNDLAGFTSYTNGGSSELSTADGQMVVNIKSCGSLDYANQAYFDGFKLNKDCVYTYSFDVSSDVDRKIEYRLQLNGGDYHAYAGDVIDIGKDVSNISVDFEMKDESDPAPRLCFNMGMFEGMGSDPGEHNIYIDNIKLEVKDSSKAQTVAGLPDYVNVAVNQLGYKPEDDKVAVVKTDTEDEEEFIVCDAKTNETVYASTLEEQIYDYGAKTGTRKADFSVLKKPGEYYVYTKEGSSYSFQIAESPYEAVYKDTVLMLYNQRCGIKLDDAISGEFAHGPCHTEEAKVYDDQSKTKDVSGGWHDAGDYGRYVVAGAVTVMDLLEAYEDFEITADDIGIPESGNEIPDLLDEARYELDWMLKMQDEETGGVYHKVTALVFPETVGPEEEKDQLYLAPVSQAATGDFAAIMAKASVVYKEIDPEFSQKAYDAAVKAWDYLISDENDKGYHNPSDIETGEYPDPIIEDERYWAAVELFIAGKEDVADYITKYSSDEELKAGLGWADVATYADYDLAKYESGELSDIGITRITAAADEIVEQSEKTGYFMGFGSGFSWGSNMTVGNIGETLYMAANLTGDETYSKLAGKQLDYLMGTNAMGYCFITGYGTLTPEQPHHRPSQVVGKAVPGMLVGGPDKNLEDPYAKAVLAEEAPALCYVDNSQSFSTNEVTIYWNSPLIYLLSAEK